MKWVTRVHPHVDRCASMWLIQKYIDPAAQFSFVPRNYHWNTDEIPFVLPTAELNPSPGQTTFEKIIEKYNLHDPIVNEMASIIHDIEQAEKSGAYQLPESQGIFTILRGIEPSCNDDYITLSTAIKVMEAWYTFLLKTSQGEKLT